MGLGLMLQYVVTSTPTLTLTLAHRTHANSMSHPPELEPGAYRGGSWH